MAKMVSGNGTGQRASPKPAKMPVVQVPTPVVEDDDDQPKVRHVRKENVVSDMITSNVGKRIKEAREKLKLTQMDIAKYMGTSRPAVTNWETGMSSPTLYTVHQVATFLQVTPEWLAFGVSTLPKIVHKAPEGTVKVEEVTFGQSPDDRTVVDQWDIPERYLSGDLHVMVTSKTILWRVDSDTMAPGYEYGDRVIVDTSATKVSPPGVFLIWDGISVVMARVRVAFTPGGKQIAKVDTSATEEGYETPVEKIVILGRIRGRFHSH